ncbi:proline--tRNA ligase, partial [candidate division WWE3 bacterium]|nr:proline--tRNA ligase [candidate division WWE3 bacterium]
TLHPLELWQETNRDNAGNFGLMKVTDRRGAEFALGGTAEEMFVDVVRKFQISYKDLPFNLYQFSQKFRDELRARGGLLRVREFTMKDAYSFDQDAESFKETYQTMADTYARIFQRVGLSTKMVAADNGYIGGEYCHEFIAEAEVGESRYLMTEDGSYCAHEDVATFILEDKNPDEEIKEMETIEQPAWVKTMDDNVKHYGEPTWRYLKNVVYKNNTSDEIIIASIRGDLEVNKTKLEKVLVMIEQLDEATPEDLEKLGTKPGYVHSWGHDATYVADLSLKTVKNFIGGQKEETTDTRNVNYGRDFSHNIEADISLAQAGLKTVDSGKELIEGKGVEVGNIFQLGHHYTTKMSKAVFTDENGEAQPLYMGCYGIGVGRTLATVAERYHDEKGLVWPMAVSPFHLHLITINSDTDSVREAADTFYSEAKQMGLEVLFDDRTDVSPGQKFTDADLIGIPLRVIISPKTIEGGYFEVKERASGEVGNVASLQEIVEIVGQLLSEF